MSTRVCAVDDVAPDSAIRVDVDGHRLAVVRCGDDVYVIGDRCTHQGAVQAQAGNRDEGGENKSTVHVQFLTWESEGAGPVVLRRAWPVAKPARVPAAEFQHDDHEGNVDDSLIGVVPGAASGPALPG